MYFFTKQLYERHNIDIDVLIWIICIVYKLILLQLTTVYLWCLKYRIRFSAFADGGA